MTLRIFSKITVFLTLFLIFAGGMVTSTGSGLSVPDWPLSYGMFFPPMVGGVFYEHGHRMVASLVGCCTLILAIWLALKEPRPWLKIMGFVALFAVILQGVLGGLTVLFLLPDAISVSHGTLAQTFFLITIFIAYNLSRERSQKSMAMEEPHSGFLKIIMTLILIIYAQLIMGAIMRHTGSGLAIYDFPTMAGEWWPSFDQNMLTKINDWRFMHDLDPVTINQVVYHFLHRVGALLIVVCLIILNMVAKKHYLPTTKIWHSVVLLDIAVSIQIILGILAVLELKPAVLTTFHVANGALTLGLTFLLLLRAAPLKWHEFTKAVLK